MARPLILRGVRQNNLKNLSLEIPTQQLIVITGLSGSGKSSLAFETIYAEGHRRFLDSLSNYARQFLVRVERPDVDSIEGLAPTIAIEQKNPIRTSRSSVGTVTEIYDFLRILFARVGTPLCPKHKTPMESLGPEAMSERILSKHLGEKGYVVFPVYLEKQKKLRTQRLEQIRARGFNRVILGEKVTDFYIPLIKNPQMKQLEELDPKELPSEKGTPLWVVADRLQIEKSGATMGRLREALSQVVKEGNGLGCFIPTEGEPLLLSSSPRCQQCGESIPEMTPQLFSFNSPLGACTRCSGFGRILKISEDKVVPFPHRTIAQGAVDPFTKPSTEIWTRRLLQFCSQRQIDIHTPWEDLSREEKDLILIGTSDFKGVEGMFAQLEEKRYKTSARVFISRYQEAIVCPECHGSRLRPESLSILVGGKNIHEVCELTLQECLEFVNSLSGDSFVETRMGTVLQQIRSRLEFLVGVGVGYLTCHRPARSLSGGEIQRINLANQLGADLTRTFYILDEPTVGLHPRDTHRLIEIMKNLKQKGNTLFVVEHDRDVMKEADWIVDMGPGAGLTGGEVMYNGPFDEFSKKADQFPKSLTAQYLSERRAIPLPVNRRKTARGKIEILGCHGNNLRNVNLRIPLGRLTVVSGVSGSGKSTLVRQTLYPAVARALRQEMTPPLPFKELLGVEKLSQCVLLDQSPIGRTPRMIPVTYLKIFDAIRFLFSDLMDAKKEGLRPGDFSFNVKGGRCEACEGEGFQRVDMHFMDDLYVRCEACDGKRYRDPILKVRWNGKSIHDVLEMTIDEGRQFFHSRADIYGGLNILYEVGLGYLKLGQPATTLSGGEAQRLKIARELFSQSGRNILYVLDEPTTGLHFEDIRRLIDLLNRLVEQGNTVVVVEHNLEVIKCADYIIDLGPDAAHEGGEIVCEGTPEEVATHTKSLISQYLRVLLSHKIS